MIKKNIKPFIYILSIVWLSIIMFSILTAHSNEIALANSNDVEVSKEFNKGNLDIDSIPTNKYVTELATKLFNLKSNKDVENLKDYYKISERVGYKLPDEKSKVKTVVPFKDSLPSNLGEPYVFIDMETLKGNTSVFLVTFQGGGTELNYLLTFEDKVLSDITSLN